MRKVSIDDLGVSVEEVGKADGKKGNAPRSKHSETEQRRRSKINERQAFAVLSIWPLSCSVLFMAFELA